MTEQQYQNWIQFSPGLVESYTLTEKRKAKILEEIDCCINYIVDKYKDQITDWDKAVYDEKHQCLHYGPGDSMSEYLWDNRYTVEKEDRKGNCESVTGRFGQMLSACVRAGFDVAVAPSAGVLGFTLGDVRQIFKGTLPQWVKDFFENPETLDDCLDNKKVWL